MSHELFIKNMVCSRCVMAVDRLLRENGFHPVSVELGHAVVEENIGEDQRILLRDKLQGIGFDLLEDRQEQTIEKMKSIIIQLVQRNDMTETACLPAGRLNLSDYLAGQLHSSYSSLSKLYSKVTGTTIERFYIAQRVEKVKELITYDELSLSQIALRMGYSSVAYLSSQFKMVTGMTPSKFKRLHANLRKSLDSVY